MSTFPIAIPAIGTLLKVGYGSPEAFYSVANIGDITGPSISAAVVDVTSHTSPSAPWHDKITTLLDAGTITLPLYFVPASTAPGAPGQFMGHGFVSGLGKLFTNRGLAPGIGYNWKIVFPDGVPTTYAFVAWISKYSQKAPVAGVLTADLELTITGSPNFTAS